MTSATTRRISLRLLLVATLVATTCAATTAAHAPASAAAAPAYAFRDLGAGFFPLGVNSDNDVVGRAPAAIAGETVPALWSAGKITPLPVPSGASSAIAFLIDDAGVISGQDYTDHGSRILRWAAASGHKMTTWAAPSSTDNRFTAGDEATGTIIATATLPDGSDSDAQPTILDESRHVLKKLPAVISGQAPTVAGVDATSYALWDSQSSNGYIGKINSSKHVDLSFRPTAMASDGSVLGSDDHGHFFLRLPDGSTSTLPMYASLVNARHDVANTHQVLSAGATTPMSVDDMLPAGWTPADGGAQALGDNGSFVGIAVGPDSMMHGYLFSRPPGISGTVYGVSCGKTTCSRGGLGGIKVLVKGTTTDGAPIEQTAKSNSSGKWSAAVPPGKYKIGPTLDGKTLVGSAFEPSEADVTVGASGKKNVNFQTCANPTGGTDKASTGRFSPVASQDASDVSLCQSLYTISMNATLPAGRIVDPSAWARFNRHADGTTDDYRNSTGHMLDVLHTKPFENGVVGIRRQYPACLPDKKLDEFDEQEKHVQWYSYIEGGQSLGRLTVTLAWNQDKDVQSVRVVGKPTVTESKVTKVWKYQYVEHGEVKKDHCEMKVDASPIVVPIAGDSPGTTSLSKSQFALVVAWAFPFTSAGVMAGPETGIAAILHEYGELGHALYERYEKLSETQKFALDFAIGLYLGKHYVQSVEVAAELIARFAPKLGYLTDIAGITAERLHKFLAVRELVNFAAGWTGEYPIMGSVLRGDFHTRYAELNGKRTNVVAGTILSMAARTTKFPDISLKIRRDAETLTEGDSVFSGKNLPWKGNHTGHNPIVTNPYGVQPAHYIAYPSGSGHKLHGGQDALDTIEQWTENMSALKELHKSVEEDATTVTGYEPLIDAIGAPQCDVDGNHTKATHESETICYYLKDGRA